MAKDDNGQFYIFADTRDPMTQTNIPATFTIADKNASSVTVVNENRTIPVVNGVFSDTFATAATVHIYEVNDGSGSGSSSGPPVITAIVTSPASGDLNAGKTVALTLDFSENVTVAGGTPTLTLNAGGTATYASGSGANALTFNYTVAAGQNTPDLMVTAVNLNAASIKDSTGNAANLSLTGVAQSSPRIDTTTPAAPVISGDTVAGNIVTLNGTAEANSTITAFDNSTKLGTAATNSSGAWTFTTGPLASGSQSFTATATDGAGNVSPTSSALVVSVTAPLVTNGSFETDSFSGWTVGGNSAPLSYGPQVFIDTNAESGAYAAAMGSVGSDGTLSQTIATTAGQTYRLSFWLRNEAAGANDFKATWNGQTLLSLSNAAQSGYTQHTYTVTATGSTTALQFSARNDPSQWDLDNISLTANGTGTTSHNADGSYQTTYAGVTGLAYSSYEDVYNTAGALVADAQDMTNGSGNLLLSANGLTISSSSGNLQLTAGADTFNLKAHATEAISATGLNSETFKYASGFGQSSITGLNAGGSASDVIQFNHSMFSGLSSSNTAAQDLASLLSSGAAAQSGSNVTINDSVGDVLTLVGVTTNTLSTYANSVFKFT